MRRTRGKCRVRKGAPAGLEALLDLCQVVLLPRQPAVEHLEQRHAEAEQVGRAPDLPARLGLRRPVVVGAEDRRRLAVRVELRGRAKVAQERVLALLVHEYVAGLDVAVDGLVLLVDEGQGVERVDGEVDRLVNGEAVVGLERFLDALALVGAHHEDDRAVLFRVPLRFADLDYVWVSKAIQERRLIGEGVLEPVHVHALLHTRSSKMLWYAR